MTIHIAFPSGEKKEYEEPQLRALWNEGVFPKDTLYWREGMDGWKPLADFMSPYAAPLDLGPPPLASAPSPAAAGGYQFTKDPRKLTKVLVVLLWIGIAIDVAAILAHLSQLALISRSYTQEEAEANDAIHSILAVVLIAGFIITGITFLKWIHRANRNSRGFGATGMEFTPGWAVGYYFIPIVSLFKPYQAMREIWQISHDPQQWQSAPTGPLLKGWWTLWVLNSIAGQVSFRMSTDTIEALRLSGYAAITNCIISIVLTLFAIRLVKTIVERQEALVTGGSAEMVP